MKQTQRATRRAFSLTEAMIGITVLAMAGAVLFLGVETSLRSATETDDETIAAGLAEQLVDEILGHHYSEPGAGDPYEYPLGPNGAEADGDGRELFDDTDDFNGFNTQPAEDTYGIELGRGDGAGDLRHSEFRLPSGRFAKWKQQASVYYVEDDDPRQKLSGSTTSNTRCVEVQILRQLASGQWKPLATARRTYTYVPKPPP